MTHFTSAPTEEAVVQLRDALTERLSGLNGAEIVGAQLGTHLNELLSPATYKSWLSAGQNLRAFAESFLVGVVTPTDRRKGLDYIYVTGGKARQVLQNFNGGLWKAFCSTRPIQEIHFDRVASTLYLVPLNTEPSNGPAIVPLNVDEHRSIREDFIAQLGNEHRAVEQLRGIASNHGEGAYANWVGALKAEPGLFRGWGVFRVESIKRIFAQRLQDLALDEATHKRLVQEFEADYLSQRNASRAAPQVASPQTVGSLQPGKYVEGSHRDLLSRALTALTDEQLARILVPLDLVAAMLGPRKQ